MKAILKSKVIKLTHLGWVWFEEASWDGENWGEGDSPSRLKEKSSQ